MPDLPPDSCEECRHVPEPLGTRWARQRKQRSIAQVSAECRTFFRETPAVLHKLDANCAQREEADRG